MNPIEPSFDSSDGLALDSDEDGVSVAEIREQIRRSLVAAQSASSNLSRWTAIDAFDILPIGPPQTHRSLDGLATGFNDLDRIIGGFRKGELITIGCLPSSGSSTLVQNIVRKIITRQSEHNIVAVHSIDATKQRFVERVICAQSKIDPFLLGRATRSERETLDKAAIALLNGNLFISDDTNASIQDIRRACSLQKRSQGLSLIVIDRLNSLGVGYGGERIALSQNIRGLKAMATDLDVPVVVTCTIDPSRVEDKTLCPRLNHLPGVVQLFSDVVAILHRPDYWFSMTDADYDRFQEQKGLEVVEFTVAHQKGGQPDVARLVFFTRWARFDNVRWTPEDITSPRQ